MLDDAKLLMTEMDSKSSSESIEEERMSRPEVPVPEEKPQEIHDKAQQSRETDSLMNSRGASSEEDATNTCVTLKIMSEDEKILSEIQEEKQNLEQLKVSMDKYFPTSLDVDDIQEPSKEDKDDFREDSGKDKDYFIPLGSLPSSLQPQAYESAMEVIRNAKDNIRKLLYQLSKAIELTYQSKQDSEDQKNYHKALFELWIKWSKSQFEDTDDDDDDNIQLLEIRTLGMSRSIALKLQSAFMDLMPKVQGFPTSLQDKMEQACYDMQQLHTSFSLSNKFEDLDKLHLTQSQRKLIQVQESLEELVCFLEK
ncbi:perilipin-3-like isoform X2 [Antechinus flavipes]|uniref:perilipin-3-like isoform X2 n=1 Tax=Antechinus flavipes TaxID=38775 RepID=UPI00223646C7|nr:perilipin-3-like isoform X2 [Antechinus flavipes]